MTPRFHASLWAVALAVVSALLAAPGAAPDARAAVMQSTIPGAHDQANPAAQVELNRVRSRLRLGNLNGAYEAALAAVRADSLSAEAFDQLASVYIGQKRHREAYGALERAALLAPARAQTWNRLAQIAYLHLGLEDQGNQALGYALAADSLFATAWYTRALYHWTRAELDLADQAIARARLLETDEAKSLVWYSTQLGIRLSRGDYVPVEQALLTHLYQAPGDLAGRQHLVHAQRGAGDLKGAKETLATLRKSAGEQPVWAIESGLVARAAGEADSALYWFDRAIALDSTSYDARYNRALQRLAAGDTARAWDDLRALRRVDAGNFLTPLLASRMHRAAGDTARARLAFDEARRLNPALGLASAAEAGGAAPVPAWASPELAEGERLVEKGELSLAGDRFCMAAQAPERKAAGAYWLSRTTRMNRGTLGLPVLAAQAGVEASGGDPVLLRALAEAQWAAGDTLRTVANLRSVRRIAPEDQVAAALLAEALLAAGDAAGARAIFNEVAQQPTRSYRVESARAAVFAAVRDPGAAIARTRAGAADYLPAGR